MRHWGPFVVSVGLLVMLLTFFTPGHLQVSGFGFALVMMGFAMVLIGQPPDS